MKLMGKLIEIVQHWTKHNLNMGDNCMLDGREIGIGLLCSIDIVIPYWVVTVFQVQFVRMNAQISAITRDRSL